LRELFGRPLCGFLTRRASRMRHGWPRLGGLGVLARVVVKKAHPGGARSRVHASLRPRDSSRLVRRGGGPPAVPASARSEVEPGAREGPPIRFPWTGDGRWRSSPESCRRPALGGRGPGSKAQPRSIRAPPVFGCRHYGMAPARPGPVASVNSDRGPGNRGRGLRTNAGHPDRARVGSRNRQAWTWVDTVPAKWLVVTEAPESFGASENCNCLQFITGNIFDGSQSRSLRGPAQPKPRVPRETEERNPCAGRPPATNCFQPRGRALPGHQRLHRVVPRDLRPGLLRPRDRSTSGFGTERPPGPLLKKRVGPEPAGALGPATLRRPPSTGRLVP